MKLQKVILVSILVLGACGQQDNTSVSNPPADSTDKTESGSVDTSVVGIDISSHQGSVDFNKVKDANATFLFAKATQGNTYIDPKYQDNYTGARAAGLIVGAYHYFMTDDEPDTQFNNFTSVVSLSSGDLPPVVDIEALANNSLPDLKDKLQKFLDLLEQKYGAKPIIYSGKNFANEYLTDLGSYPLWLAEYEVTQPTLPKGWTTWTFWQWTQSGTIAGIEGPVDQSRFQGTKTDLEKLLLP